MQSIGENENVLCRRIARARSVGLLAGVSLELFSSPQRHIGPELAAELEEDSAGGEAKPHTAHSASNDAVS